MTSHLPSRIAACLALLGVAACGGGGGGGDSAANPATGQVDPTYASGGRHSFTFPGYAPGPSSRGRVALASDGTVYMAAGPTVRRLDSSGNLDPTFGVELRAHSPLLDEAGNLYVMTSEGIAKLDPDGRLVTSFGTNGVALAPGMVGGAGSFARDGAGNLVLAGYAQTSAVAISKFDRDGRLVASFGSAGVHRLQAPAGYPGQNSVDAVALDAQGNVFVGGHGFALTTAARLAFVAKLDADGRIATDFGDAGFWHAPPICSSRAPHAIAFDAFGYVHVACEPAIFKLDNHGNLDHSFGLLGVSTPLGGAVTSLHIASNGEIFVAGARDTAQPQSFCTDFIAAKLDVRGAPVTGFGAGGRVIIDVDNNDYVASVAMDGSGRLYVSGVSIGPCSIRRPVPESIFSVIRLR